MTKAGGTSMIFDIEKRPSDSSFVERVWRAQSERTGLFISSASIHSELVVWKYQGKTTVTLRGPETKATFDQVSFTGGEFFGITFKLGVFMPYLLPKNLLDRRDVNLPGATTNRFWLQGSAWELPTYENADTFIQRLMHDGLLVRDDIVTSVLQNETPAMSVQHLRRRYLRATGLTPGTIHQIERARKAIHLLEQGMPILDVVFETGYFDQPHLTRSLKRFFGQTPAQIARIGSQIPRVHLV
jgi:hypothetical protein